MVIQAMTSLVKLYFVITSLLFLRSLSEGNWRLVVLAYSIPAFLCFFGSIYVIDESARFLIAMGRIDDALKIIEKMGKMNHGSKWVPLSRF